MSALVRLGELTPEDIQVQLITGRVDADDQLFEPRINPFPTGTDVDPSTGSGQRPSTGSGHGLRRYESWVPTRRAGELGYTVRVVPHHPLLASDAEMGLAALPAEMSAPPSA